MQRQQYESWRRTLLQCLANVEAVIDFGEDEGIAEEVAEQVLPRVQHLGQQLRQHLVSGELSSLLFMFTSSFVTSHTGSLHINSAEGVRTLGWGQSMSTYLSCDQG